MTMRNKLIEAATRAIWDTKYPNPSGNGTTWDDWQRHVEAKPESFDGRNTSRKLAIAAVDTVLGLLMEPSEEMVEAARDAGCTSDNGGLERADPTTEFKAMLGAIK